MRSGLVLCWLACAGCFRPTPPAGAPCNEAGECPAPLVCNAGTCGLTSQDAQLVDAVVPQDILSTMTDAAPDAAPDAPPACAPAPSLGAFGAPTLVMTLSTAALDGTPSITADGLEIFIKSSRAGGVGGTDIWMATRASNTSPWGTPVNVTELNTSAEETAPDISPDGLTIYFSSTRAGTLGDYDLYLATRVSRNAAWSAPVHITELSSPQLEQGIFVSSSGLVAYFHSNRDSGGGASSLYRATRATAQSMWSTPARVIELDSGSGDENPWLSADDCTMYFQSSRAGSVGSADLWVTRRMTPTGSFGAPVLVPTVNSTAYDADPLPSANERYLMFVSNRAGGAGDFDVYEASR